MGTHTYTFRQQVRPTHCTPLTIKQISADKHTSQVEVCDTFQCCVRQHSPHLSLKIPHRDGCQCNGRNKQVICSTSRAQSHSGHAAVVHSRPDKTCTVTTRQTLLLLQVGCSALLTASRSTCQASSCLATCIFPSTGKRGSLLRKGCLQVSCRTVLMQSEVQAVQKLPAVCGTGQPGHWNVLPSGGQVRTGRLRAGTPAQPSQPAAPISPHTAAPAASRAASGTGVLHKPLEAKRKPFKLTLEAIHHSQQTCFQLSITDNRYKPVTCKSHVPHACRSNHLYHRSGLKEPSQRKISCEA